MSEHWKSTPKYWCKHCACYVRDTKLEKQNHEATARHQGAIKRSLRTLHYAHEREERDKVRAQQEIARLNGVVTHSGPRPTTSAAHPKPAASAESDLKRQRDQLAELGVAVPSMFRQEMAMAGEWTVTNSRVVEGEDEHGKAGAGTEAVATGVRKRDEVTEEQRDEEEALERLFKKPRTWGRDSKMAAQDGDPELDALLSGTAIRLKKQASDDEDAAVKEETTDGGTRVKKEGAVDDDGARVKREDDADEAEAETRKAAVKADGAVGEAVVFKKRKAKGIRTR
ncbi:hypothetical protein G6O67_007894 [Ophiocordyceps sinensis]|uniref:U1-type domain-containing protein n=1 Tax=Ophiocordyceps sinensis TaxID=72228 RepID=A0A8H4PKF6_9HYPO|nr:hypothetical protein G6O67_007894 [Ophiocordyceps sinensis]